jgi:hypothetical protein
MTETAYVYLDLNLGHSKGRKHNLFLYEGLAFARAHHGLGNQRTSVSVVHADGNEG